MRRPLKTLQGIVIAIHPSGESDLVARVLTKTEGKISLIAKHARKSTKRFSGSLDLFDQGNFELAGSSGQLHSLQGFSCHSALRPLRENLDKMVMAGLVCEAFDALSFEDSTDSAEIFSILQLALEAISNANSTKESGRACYLALAELLRISGFRDAGNQLQPSAKNLLSLVKHIEQVSNREMRSRDALQDILVRVLTEQNVPNS